MSETKQEAKYTVVESKNAFGSTLYELRNPSGVCIDTDYANEQKLQRRADDLNKEIEVATEALRQRIDELESTLKLIALNAPAERPANPAEWQMFIAGQLAKSALGEK